MVNEQRLLQLFIRLVETDSPSGKEGKLRDLLREEFQRLGYQAVEDGAADLLGGDTGNLLVTVPGTLDTGSLLFVAHMDTVQPGVGVKAKVEGDRITSAGETILGSDDKAAIAAMLEALEVLREQGLPHPPLEYLFTVSEEQGLMGSKVFDFSRVRSRLAYVLDSGGEPGCIVVQSPCQNEIEYTVYGKAAHAGISPEQGINAIQAAAGALAVMPCGRIDAQTTCNFGTIEGGVARNIVAPSCRIKGEARSLKREYLDAITDELVQIFTRTVEASGAQAEVEVKFLYPEMRLDPLEEVVELAVTAAQNIGLDPQLVSTGGGSDASMVNGAGIRCANLATGMCSVHTTDEYILIKDLIDDARLVLAIIEQAGRKWMQVTR
ncbi:MAG: M20/M25/M40 family metallo-hydrolase [Deltaproteobacteria bacterium]